MLWVELNPNRNRQFEFGFAYNNYKDYNGSTYEIYKV